MTADRSDRVTAVPRLLALDWGTSSLRGALLDGNGAVLDERASAAGLLSLPAGGWAARFDAAFGDWMARWPQLVCLMAGMVGSRQGWVEVPYRACPATLGDLVAGLHWLPGGRQAIVPGLSVDHGIDSDARVPDVMRGEETQVFGALQLLGLCQATLLLPGTHSKWVQVRDGRVLDFRTHMTGECYALLRHQSILAKGLPALVGGATASLGPAGAADDALDAAAFDDGVRQAGRAGGLLHHLFGVRSLAAIHAMWRRSASRDNRRHGP